MPATRTLVYRSFVQATWLSGLSPPPGMRAVANGSGSSLHSSSFPSPSGGRNLHRESVRDGGDGHRQAAAHSANELTLPSPLQLRQWLADRLRKAISIAMGGREMRDDISIVVTEAVAHARSIFDFQSSAAISLAGKGGGSQSAEDIAQGLLNNLEVERPLTERVVALTAVSERGFINFRLSNSYLAAQLKYMFLTPPQNSCLGFEKVKQPQRIVIDYASPNICKDLHVGHLRSAVVGDALANMLEFAGNVVHRQNHLGDFGWPAALVLGALEDTDLKTRAETQALARALAAAADEDARGEAEASEKESEQPPRAREEQGGPQRGEREGTAERGAGEAREGHLQQEENRSREGDEGDGENPPMSAVNWTEIYQAAKEKAQSDPAFKQLCEELLRRLQTGDETSEIRQQWRLLRKLSLERFESTYRLLGLRHQEVRGESFYAFLVPEVFRLLSSYSRLRALASGALGGVVDAEAVAQLPRDATEAATSRKACESPRDGGCKQRARTPREIAAHANERRERTPEGRVGTETESGANDPERSNETKGTGGSGDENEVDLHDGEAERPGQGADAPATEGVVVLKKPTGALTSNTLKAARILYVVDRAQAAHFRRVFSLARSAGLASRDAAAPLAGRLSASCDVREEAERVFSCALDDGIRGTTGAHLRPGGDRPPGEETRAQQQTSCVQRESEAIHGGTQETQLEHVALGLVKNAEGLKMKSREGQAPQLDELVVEAVRQADEELSRRIDNCMQTTAHSKDREAQRARARILGVAAVKYAELSTRRDADYVYSPAKMLSQKGNTAPYILYSLVRVRGILRRAGWDDGPPPEVHESRLLMFAMALEDAVEALIPSKLTAYLYSLCLVFNAFYEKCQVTAAADEGLRTTRLLLVYGVRRILEKTLNLLGIQAVDTL
ncbi:DALR anticodon binding domain-containing protein [Besnoitia besnoiti]|uniref:arginine--tRNA ligase n=1 Tax=Besnoitia besnoiti TaxID=94643 RepID=A0A2A9MP87_BESBE|nr:DALR anticodon binding domain-containing protein [Besnoitia besnoiti]PFH38461.1 DALR anticodon binding domain-containing protein [Besnoitia besnoiti]